MQARALETQTKILTAALQLYAEKGYYTTTVDQIAARAQVSTGIAYRYYKNKKELLLAALGFAFSQMDLHFSDSMERFLQAGNPTDLSNTLEQVLDAFVKIHRDYRPLHEELESLRHSDPDVKALYDQVEHTALEGIITALQEANPTLSHLQEKIYLTIGLMEDYCHKVTDPSFAFLDQETLKKLTLSQISLILQPS